MVLTSLKCNSGRCPFGCNCTLGFKISLVKHAENGEGNLGEYNECFDVISSDSLLSDEIEHVFDELE